MKRTRLGGIAGHKSFGDNIYEYGTHVFHTDKPWLFDRVKGLLGPGLLEHERDGKIEIKFRGQYFAYPLKGLNLFANLPASLAMKAGMSFAKSVLLHDCILRSKPRNAEEYLIQKFGRTLYEVFFKDYSHKVWGVTCAELDEAFGSQRIPRSDVFSVVKTVLKELGLSKLVDSHPLSETVIGKVYYTGRGVGEIFAAIGDVIGHAGSEVLLNTEVKQMRVEGGQIRAVKLECNGEVLEREPDYVVSTIPLPILVECMARDAPLEVLNAGQSLRYRAIALVGLLIDKPQVRSAYFTYYQNYRFNRLSEPKNHGLRVTPEHQTSVIAETVCEYGDQAYQGEESFCRTVVEDMVTEGLFKRGEVAEVHPYSWRFAYPLYLTGFQRHVETIHSYVEGLANICSTGRNGDFNYVNMHHAMEMGFESIRDVDRCILES